MKAAFWNQEIWDELSILERELWQKFVSVLFIAVFVKFFDVTLVWKIKPLTDERAIVILPVSTNINFWSVFKIFHFWKSLK